MKKAIGYYAENMYCGGKRNEFTINVTNNDDGTTAPLGDIRRFAVSSRGEGLDIADRLGIEIISWE